MLYYPYIGLSGTDIIILRLSYHPEAYFKSHISYTTDGIFNSSPSSAAYMRRKNGSSLLQVMACRLLGAKPLPEPVLTYC